MRIFQAIMCGGEGKRLWPLSRRSLPKYYIPLEDGESLFQKAFRRALRTSAVEDILLVTTDVNKHNALKQARAIIPSFPQEGLIIRPEGKETFATLACALGAMIDRGASQDDVLVCSPADHVVRDVAAYSATMREACEQALKRYTVVGIVPTEPSSDFGYIACDPKSPDDVLRFTEKPDRATAERFLAEGNYLWNAGFHIGSLQIFLREISANEATAHEIISGGLANVFARFDELPGKSIDYVVAEKVENMGVVRARFDWDDLGDLDSFINARGTAQRLVAFDAKNITACVDGKLVVALGVDNITIVDDRDAILVAANDTLCKLPTIVDALRAAGHQEVDHHCRGYRPWGYFELLEAGKNFVVKKIVVSPGCASAVQSHTRHAETWVIVSGIARTKIDDEVNIMHPGESVHIGAGTKHRVENPSLEPLVLIETWTGEYFGDDDVQRHETFFDRGANPSQN